MNADGAAPGGADDAPVLGGRAVDVEHVALLMARMAQDAQAGHAPDAADVPALQGVRAEMPAGVAGRGYPAPTSGDTMPGDAMRANSPMLPGSAWISAGTTALLQGQDPSLLTLDLLPLHPAGRDMPASQPRRASLAGMPVRQMSPGSPMAMPTAASFGWAEADKAPAFAPANESVPYFLRPQHLPPPGPYSAPGLPRGRRIRDDFPILGQRVHGGHRLVWLDSGATTQKPNAVIEAERAFYRHDNSNVHRGAHTLARRSTDAYEGARRKVQAFLGADSAEEIVFVRGATEALNLVAQSLGRQIVGEGDEVLVSHLEHHSNIVPWQMLCHEKKARLRVIPVNDRGDIDLDGYARLLGPRVRIVAVTQVANVLGTLVPIAPMAAMAHRHGAVIVVDGAQSVARLPVDVKSLDVDFYALSGHKLYAPTGIGALYGRKALLESMPPWQGGGSMIESVSFEHTVYAAPPAKFEAGTGHFAGAVGLAAAIDYLESLGREYVAQHEAQLMRYAVERLSTVPGLRLLGAPAVRVGALPFVLQGHEPAEVARALDLQGIAVRAGHHCAQPILRRFGLDASVRASLGVYSERDDIDHLVATLRRLAGASRR